MLKKKLISLIVMALLAVSCAGNSDPSDPNSEAAKTLRKVVTVLDTVRASTAELVKAKLVAEKDGKIVDDSLSAVIVTVRAAPLGWRATVESGLNELENKLDQAAKQRIVPYIAIARIVLATIE